MLAAAGGCVGTADGGDTGAGNGAGTATATGSRVAVTRGATSTLSIATQADQAPLWPSLLRFVERGGAAAEDPRTDGARLADIDGCGDCHPEAMATWEQSAHRYASMDNPIYRGSVEAFAKERGAKAAQLCGGCHDTALMVDGVFAAALAGELGADDPRLTAGVNCLMCHRAQATRAEGNASLLVSLAPVPTPTHGDAASIERHRAAVRIAAPRAALCSGCHRGFVSRAAGHPHLLVGIDEVTAWQSSPYAGHGAARLDDPLPRRDCVDCHMKEEVARFDDPAARDGKLRAHRASGGHTWLAAMRGDGEALAAAQAMLQGAATIDVAAAGPLGGARAYPAEALVEPFVGDLVLDVVVRNVGAGHRFPGGVTDMQDTWIELSVVDRRGRLVAAAGREHAAAGTSMTDDVHVLRSYVADREGGLRDDHLIASLHTVVSSRVVAPRGTEVVRYGLSAALLAATEGPLRVRARLLHRSRNALTSKLACRASQRYRGATLDGCVPQPVTELASSEHELFGAGADGLPWPRLADRLYELGLGLAQGLGEHVQDAQPALEASLAAAAREPVSADQGRRRARVWVELARVASRQGRTAEALAWLRRAEDRVGPHAAIAAVRGDAFAVVWRWAEASAAFAEGVALAPGNLGLWISLARARGSSGDDAGAWAAALAGLSLSPREPALLRSAALAAGRHGDEEAGRFQTNAYDDARGADDDHEVRMRCQASDERCRRESDPVHLHWLRAPETRAEPAAASRQRSPH